MTEEARASGFLERFESHQHSQSAIKNFDLSFGYGIYSKCINLTADRLKHLSGALIEELAGLMQKKLKNYSFTCPTCEGTLYQPVTSNCGHTYCRNCYESDRLCIICGQKIGPIGETNVLVQRLVEMWWPREAEASRARHEGDCLIKDGRTNEALGFYDAAVELVPNSPLHLSNRAHALLLLNRPQAALTDADCAVRLRPDWSKGHYRRGIALSALGRHEEAFFALCTSVALDKNIQNVRLELSRVLHRILSTNHRRQTQSSRSPYHQEPSIPRARRNRDPYRGAMRPNQRNQRRATLNSSDCEDNSSSEEEFSQAICRRLLSNNFPQTNLKFHNILDRVYQELEKLKRIEPMPAEILLPPLTSIASQSDLDCILCCRSLWKPVTTPCGHTYCWMCLDRCLDYSSTCPLCVTPLADYLASNQKTVTEFLEKALMTIAPTEYTARATSHRLELFQDLGILGSQHIAVFVCTTAFPCVACPLFVYEPRYRLMVRRCVESGVRRFGIAACLNKDATGSKRYAEYGTVLEIRDRVLLKDGCSILSTVGGRRFRVLSGGERDGYDTAEVELLRDSHVAEEHLPSLHELHYKVWYKCQQWWSTVSQTQQYEIQRVFGKIPNPEEDWWRLPDGPSWTWWILSILPFGPQLQVGILGTTSLEKRLRAIDKTLSHMEKRQLTINSQPTEETTTSNTACSDSDEITSTTATTTISIVHHS